MKDYYREKQDQGSTGVDKAVTAVKARVGVALGKDVLAEHDNWLERWIDVLLSDPDTNVNTWVYKGNYWAAVERTLYEKLLSQYTAGLDGTIELCPGEPRLLENLRKSLFYDEYQYLQGYGNCCVHMIMMNLLPADYWEKRKASRFEHMDMIINAIDTVMRKGGEEV